jgi:hypothetical protein
MTVVNDELVEDLQGYSQSISQHFPEASEEQDKPVRIDTV